MLTAGKGQASCLLLAITLLVLATPVLQFEWQGTGNMTESNMTQVKTIIAENPVHPGLHDQDRVALNISTSLNNLWDPAWNVVIAVLSKNVDTIVYGYAFRGHWVWFNGMPGSYSGEWWSYIIWKDYNCMEWQTMNGTVNLTNDQTLRIIAVKNTIFADNINNDLWNTARYFVTELQASSEFAGGAFTVVLSQDPSNGWGGYICIKNHKMTYFSGLGSAGSIALFQMR